jgi:hypothetical protein
MTDKVVDRINETNPGLFVRWNEPRFLAVLTSVQRSYAETGDEDLGNTLASLVAGLASKPIRSMHEIVLRQAIDVAPHLTSAHLKALTVNLLLTRFHFNQAYDTELLITALDTQFSPYYGELPSSQLDYSYMSSTGVGSYMEGLQDLGNRPYQLVHKRYPNSMYPSFAFAEIQEIVSAEDQRLLAILPDSPDDVVQTGETTRIANIDRARFRVVDDRAAAILSNVHGAEEQLTEPERQLRTKVRERSLSADQFRDQITELKPELAEFLRFLEESGAMNFQLHPVGIVLARHEMGDRAPHLATQIDDAFDAISPAATE